MTISRGQMNRQLYMGGGIMNARPRQQYGLGSFVKKAVKKVTGAVKDVASSDLGKAALLATAGAYAGGLGPFASGARFGNIAGAGFLPNLFTGAGIGASTVADGLTAGVGPKRSLLSNLFSKIPGGGVTAAIGGASILSGLLTKAQMEEIDEADPDERGDIVAEKLRQSLTRLGVSGEELERRVAEGVSEYTGYTSKAEGGRIGYADGTYEDFEKFMMRRSESLSERHKEELRKQFEMYMRSKDPTVEAAEGGRIGFADGPVLPPDPTQPVNPFGPKPPADAPVLPDRMASNMENDKILEALFEKYLDMGLSPKDAAEKAREEFERMGKGNIKETRGLAALGGKMDTASDNAMQAAGIEGLPIRQNPKGVKELDLRNTGGFIQPVGIKEKEDDIPAMLSNNEFVFTADAVRGMGDGNVNVGAQRMYDMMKKLEAGGRV